MQLTERKIKQKLISLNSIEREEGLVELQGNSEIILFSEISHLAFDLDANVRIAFLETLYLYGRDIVVEHGIQALSDDDEIVRITACEILMDAPPEEPLLSTLIKHLDDSSELVRRDVAEIFGFAGGKKYLEMLGDKLRMEKSIQSRIGLISALCRLSGIQHAENLIPFLRSNDYHDRCATARTLGEIYKDTGNEEIIDVLKNALSVETTVAGKEAIKESINLIKNHQKE